MTPIGEVNKEGLRAATFPPRVPPTRPPTPPPVTPGKTKKVFPRAPGRGKYDVFSLICFAQLNFRLKSLPHLSTKVVTPGGGRGPKVKSGASKKQVSTSAAACPSEVIHLFPANYHDSVKKKRLGV